MALQLTDQQQLVVNHDHGPALVFAVAGAGKTTAMVHRIERLVREGIFPAEKILATSFGRANVHDLRRELSQWSYCDRVDGRTLHSLGRDIIKRAQRGGHLRQLQLNGSAGESVEQKLLNFTLAEAYRQNVPFKKELDSLDRQDFLAYVGYCKGNLLYADLGKAKLSPDAYHLAKQAMPPAGELGWYLDLYQLMEQVRLRQGMITFDDMLLTGWETLLTYESILEETRQMYQCIIVDEYQDINLAQSVILDLVTEPHRNLMAIGDDDQTIYEWRGANPKFILEFDKKYKVKPYYISDNFRCPAAPLLLANEVIHHNKKRSPKRLSLTRGFTGQTYVHEDADVVAMSKRIVSQVQKYAEDGLPLHEMAVLVRLNAQTPHIEQELITAGVPYQVSKPFYDRVEIQTLIHYGRLGWIEQMTRAGKRPLANPAIRRKFEESWRSVANRPKRYLSRERREYIYKTAVRQVDTPLSDIIRDLSYMVEEWQAEPLEMLADVLQWVSGKLDKPADAVLADLDFQLDYQTYLRDSSGFPQTGEGRAASVAAFIQYARGQGDLQSFMQHIKVLADQKTGLARQAKKDAVVVSTIHQAKGLEWPVVFVPQVSQDILPFQASRTGDVEEERRLFYVALTRTKRELHLHTVKTEKPSQFLHEARWQNVLETAVALETILALPIETWDATHAYTLLKQAPIWHLERYFQLWFDVTERELVARRMVDFVTAVAHHNLQTKLAITPDLSQWWHDLIPDYTPPSPNGFPGIEKVIRVEN